MILAHVNAAGWAFPFGFLYRQVMGNLIASGVCFGSGLVAGHVGLRRLHEKVDSHHAEHTQAINDHKDATEKHLDTIRDELRRLGRDNGAALAELLDLVRQAPLPEPKQPGVVFPPRPPSTDQTAG